MALDGAFPYNKKRRRVTSFMLQSIHDHRISAPVTADNPQLELDSLLRICANLTAPKTLREILDDLLTEARTMVRADAGSVYLGDGDSLRFVCRQIAGASGSCVLSTMVDALHSVRLGPLAGQVSRESVAAHVARTRRPLNIVDVYQLPQDAPFRFDASFDRRTGYRTVSMLAVPMTDRNDNTVGVLQLINRRSSEDQTAPFSARDEQLLVSLAALAAVTVRNAQLHEQLHRSHLDTILHLANAAEFRDGDTGEHIRRMSCYCEAVARALSQPPEWCRRILFASPMHDVGKLALPDAILKKPGPLTSSERAQMQQHTVFGARILRGSDNEILQMAERIAAGHHERWDGAGYPDGLRGDAIPIEARIASIADVFDALTNVRVYKPAYSLDEAVRQMADARGRQFDPVILDAFEAARDEIAAIHEAYR